MRQCIDEPHEFNKKIDDNKIVAVVPIEAEAREVTESPQTGGTLLDVTLGQLSTGGDVPFDVDDEIAHDTIARFILFDLFVFLERRERCECVFFASRETYDGGIDEIHEIQT